MPRSAARFVGSVTSVLAPHVSHARVVVVGSLASCILAAGVSVLTALSGGSGSSLTGGTASAAQPEGDASARALPAPMRRTADGELRGLKIAWVGDMVLGSRHGIPPEEGRGLLAGTREDLRGADVTFGNYEGTFGSGGVPKCPVGTPNCFAFQAPPEHARTLRWAGFDVVNLANNHAFDYGADGLGQTVAALGAAGVDHTGAPGRIALIERHGVKLAFIGFAPYPWSQDLTDLAGARAIVTRAARAADVVVVAMHIGAEGSDQTHTPSGPEGYLGEARGDSRAFAHAVVEAGADLVVGSGPHVVRGVERHRGRLIAYSTGNFAGYHTFSQAGTMGLSAILRVVVDVQGRPLRARWQSIRIQPPGQPVNDPAGTSAHLVGQLSREDFGASAAPPEPDGTIPIGRRAEPRVRPGER